MKLWIQKYKYKYYITIPILGMIMLSDRIFLNKYSIHKTHDGFDSFIPLTNQIIEKLYSLELPGWNADYMGGMPYNLMDINWISIPVLIGGFMPFPMRMFLIEYTQFLIAGIGMYLFLEHNYKLEYITKYIGAIFWSMFLINMTYWRIQDLALIPLLLVSTQKVLENSKSSRWYFGLLICALNMSFAKGAPFLGLFHLVYFVFIDRNISYKVIKLFLLYWIFIVLINMPVISTLIINNDLGSRSLITSYSNPNEISNLNELSERVKDFILSPFINIGINYGIIILALFIFSLFTIKTWSKKNRNLFIYYIAILFFVTFIDRSSWFVELREMLPLTEFRLSRFILVFPFILLIVSICNLEKCILFLTKKRKLSILYLFLLTSILSYYHLNKHPYPSNYFEVLVEIFTFIAILTIVLILVNKNSKVFSTSLAFIVVITYFLNIHFVRISDIHPPSYKHFFESNVFEKIQPTGKSDYRIAFINWHPTIGIENSFQVAGGYASQYLKNYALFWRSIVKAEQDEYDNYNFKAYLINNDVKHESSPPKKIYDLKINTNLLALNNVRYLLSLSEIVDPKKYGLKEVVDGVPYSRKYGFDSLLQVISRIGENIHYYVYEVSDYLPRLKFVSEAVVLNDDRALYELIDSLDKQQINKYIYYSAEMLNDHQKKVIDSYQKEIKNKELRASISNLHYGDDVISFNTDTNLSTQLLVNENYMRDWELYIDDKKRLIIPAYNSLRSIIIEEGSHSIKMVYSPKYLLISYWVSGGTLLISIIMLFALVKNRICLVRSKKRS